MIAGVAAMSALSLAETQGAQMGRAFLEIKTWQLHNSQEDQARRLSEYLDRGLFPALNRAGAKPVGAFANLIGDGGPYIVSIVQYPSMGAIQETLAKLQTDAVYQAAVQQWSAGPGLPFVRIESTLLQSLNCLPEPAIPADIEGRHTRIFELRTYESQTLETVQQKAGMFNGGEIAIFQRLGMRPVFIGEALIGARMPCITYMLSFDNLDAREKLWQAFGSDPEWKRISAPANLKDAEIVANISNVMLRPLSFSPVR